MLVIIPVKIGVKYGGNLKSFIGLLKLIDEYEVIGRGELANYFGMKYKWADNRLERLQRAGLVEQLGAQRGRWLLLVKGIKYLEHQRRKEDAERRRGKERSTGG